MLLEKGWQFRNYRKALKADNKGIPTGFQWFSGTILYSVMPYDRSYWGARYSSQGSHERGRGVQACGRAPSRGM